MISMLQRKIALALSAAALLAARPAAAQVFGTAGEVPFALHGRVYYIPENTETLPDFSRLRPVGTISTTTLNIQPQSFTAGFPGVTDRFEWFAIDYTGRISLAEAGTYTFRLTSDDGSRLYIDGREVIDNDGIHGPGNMDAEVELTAGIHDVRVSYFQGPREEIALVLEWGPDAESLRPLDFAALAPARFRREGNRLRAEMSGGVLFDPTSAELRREALSLLAELKRTMIDPNPARISIEGHTDDVGADADNQSLSERRARSVAAWLTAQGVAAARMDASGAGESRPAVPNTSAANRAKNRRIEITVTLP